MNKDIWIYIETILIILRTDFMSETSPNFHPACLDNELRAS